MAPPLKVYSADEVTCNFAGISLEGGTGDDDFVSITKTEDTFTYKAGNDGSGTRSKNGSRYFEVSVTLMATSEKNALLSAIHILDGKSAGGSGVGPLKVEDRGGTTKFLCAEAWVKKIPDLSFKREAETVTWVFGCHNPEFFLGGN